MEAVLDEHREHEKSLRNTLMTAQKLADDIKANAEEEAERVVREAAGRSELLLEKTQARLEDVQREIDGLKLKRRDVETSIEATIQTLRNTLEFVREQEVREREEKILLHRPRHAEPTRRRRPGRQRIRRRVTVRSGFDQVASPRRRSDGVGVEVDVERPLIVEPRKHGDALLVRSADRGMVNLARDRDIVRGERHVVG